MVREVLDEEWMSGLDLEEEAGATGDTGKNVRTWVHLKPFFPT